MWEKQQTTEFDGHSAQLQPQKKMGKAIHSFRDRQACELADVVKGLDKTQNEKRGRPQINFDVKLMSYW
ncbi:MAG: hypothetical protein JST43_01635 [Bacteroidetes bacterium]|nr:hypothetical protein [Bacteroidota bacterium]MBS1540539.1 hypothetical protein [Bacteroidota bacterium]